MNIHNYMYIYLCRNNLPYFWSKLLHVVNNYIIIYTAPCTFISHTNCLYIIEQLDKLLSSTSQYIYTLKIYLMIYRVEFIEVVEIKMCKLIVLYDVLRIHRETIVTFNVTCIMFL